MLKTDDRSNLWSSEEFSLNDDDLVGDDLSIDIGTFLDILAENPDSSERRPEDLSFNDASQGLPNKEGFLSSRADLSRSASFSPPYNFVTSDIRTGISDNSSKSAEKSIVSDGSKHESPLLLGSPVHSSSGSLTDWVPHQGHGHFCLDNDIVSRDASSSSLQDCKETQHEIHNCNETFSFPAGYFNNHVADNTEASNFDHLNHECEFRYKYLEGVNDYEHSYETPSTRENKLEVSVAPHLDESSGISKNNDRLAEYSGHNLSTPYFMNPVGPSYASSNQFNPCGFGFKSLPDDNKMIGLMKEKVEHLTQDTSSMMSTHVWELDDAVWEVPMPGDLAAEGLSVPSGGVNYDSLGDVVSTSRFNDGFCMKQENGVKDVNFHRLIASQVIASQHANDITSMKSSADAGLSPGEGLKPTCSGYWISNSSGNHEFFPKEERDVIHESKRLRLCLDEFDGTASGMASSVVHDQYWDLLNSDSRLPVSRIMKQQVVNANVAKGNRPSLPHGNGSHISSISGLEIHSDSSVQTYQTDDDEDVCILEDISGPARANVSAVSCKTLVAPKSTLICNSFNSVGLGHFKLKANGEHFVFQAALEDLCQPKSEDTPPEGLLAVPLLKHQRIALSWMVKKENGVLRCSGGFLADDQGLGKTVSTIALILKERSPSSIESNKKESVAETLNLDDDEDIGSNVGKSNQGPESCPANGSSCGQKATTGRAKLRRPAAGTLIVCPTSVLRQWSEEIQNKVSSKANLSVLVYHGSNRTKDPHELAKYDIVLTTYSIVSMEVPKQPLVDDEDDETKSPKELSLCKKRKYPPSSNKKSSNCKNGLNGELLDIRPLAGVGWFRVVLDEAQCIKNHRTQVARACWGLRAKRRWCLSGTPIQNTIDDLYSYFRFLKYDPYWIYKEFCSGIKAPIQENPANGYKKLQAVLKTIMLRRTKGTLLDGEPIINLPPKTIKLCRVDFTQEEREFYCRLEADSRAQFAEYAAAGTVKQNYVNILLMLLRLRQACDHPLLVRGFSSGSKSTSSLEMAKKLPQEKQVHLLNCFEDSSICGICSDPPEDAVVTSCGHVFCNQCICEHLSGDDTHCPTTNCKAHLDRSAVFSVATLRCSLSDQTTLESNSDGSLDCAYDSSKIKAAIEVLQSLTKRQNYSSSLSSVEEGTSSVENTSSLPSGGLQGQWCKEEDIKGMGEASSASVAVMGEKAIVFSQWTRMLDLLESCLRDSSIQYRRLDGTMSVAARDKAVKDFNTLPEVSVMIMSLKAASLGLNMVAACHVLLLDLWWNPTTEDQAVDRAHRIGQTRPVTVLRLTVKDTVEDRILALQQKKREMVANAFGEDETGGQATRLTLQDLEYLFRGKV